MSFAGRWQIIYVLLVCGMGRGFEVARQSANYLLYLSAAAVSLCCPSRQADFTLKFSLSIDRCLMRGCQIEFIGCGSVCTCLILAEQCNSDFVAFAL